MKKQERNTNMEEGNRRKVQEGEEGQQIDVYQRELMSSFQAWITSLSPVRYRTIASSTTRRTIE